MVDNLLNQIHLGRCLVFFICTGRTLADDECKISTDTKALRKVIFDACDVVGLITIGCLHNVPVCVWQKREVSADFNIREVVILNFWWLWGLRRAPNKDFSLLVYSSWGVPSRDWYNLAQLRQLDWSVLVLGVTGADLALSIVSGGPNLTINKEKSVVFTARNHLNVLVFEELELGRCRDSVKISNSFKIKT